jgi:hypothetical protein
MLLHSETVALPDEAVLELALWAERGRRLRYRLRYGREGAWLVEYDDGRKRVGGRAARYEFKSVEQLRYDFERDLEGLADGEDAADA